MAPFCTVGSLSAAAVAAVAATPAALAVIFYDTTRAPT